MERGLYFFRFISMTISQIDNYNISDQFISDQLWDFQLWYALILTSAFDSVVSVLGINKKIRSITTNTQDNVINHSWQVKKDAIYINTKLQNICKISINKDLNQFWNNIQNVNLIIPDQNWSNNYSDESRNSFVSFMLSKLN